MTPLNPHIIGGASTLPAPAEPRYYPARWIRGHDPAARMSWRCGSGRKVYLRRAGEEAGEVLTQLEAARRAGTVLTTVRRVCSARDQARNGGKFGGSKGREIWVMRWATEEEINAAGAAEW